MHEHNKKLGFGLLPTAPSKIHKPVSLTLLLRHSGISKHPISLFVMRLALSFLLEVIGDDCDSSEGGS